MNPIAYEPMSLSQEELYSAVFAPLLQPENNVDLLALSDALLTYELVLRQRRIVVHVSVDDTFNVHI